MCSCAGVHAVRLTGSETTRAAEYLPRFCSEYAAAAAEAYRADPPSLGAEEADAMASGTPPVYETLWLNELLRCLPWRMCASRPVSSDAHLNVRELRSALRHALAEAGNRTGHCDCPVFPWDQAASAAHGAAAAAGGIPQGQAGQHLCAPAQLHGQQRGQEVQRAPLDARQAGLQGVQQEELEGGAAGAAASRGGWRAIAHWGLPAAAWMEGWWQRRQGTHKAVK